MLTAILADFGFVYWFDNLQKITLHLARCHEFPKGSAKRGYQLIAPIDNSGHLDINEWKQHRAVCFVRRFWADQSDRRGMLVHKAGGSHGATWKIHYTDSEEDDIGAQLETHRFIVNEYVSIRDHDGELRTFKLVGIRPEHG